MARFQTFAKDSHYLVLLQESDRAAIARFESLNRELTETRRHNEASVERLLALRGELDEEVRQLSEREEYLRRSMGDVAKNRELFRQYVDDVERMMASMEAAIARMEHEAREARAIATPRDMLTLRGALPPPVEGEVVAAYGAQDPRYDLKKRQRGILLRVAANAPVAAVAPGRAVHAGPFRGYQSLVVLDHGQGVFSVYGHLEALELKRGDWVAQGHVLGRATYQPVGESYDVYFEVRHNGQPDDPLTWLRPGAVR
jgi:septal ring factor EnvC (AmiA/AmiB activator)